MKSPETGINKPRPDLTRSDALQTEITSIFMKFYGPISDFYRTVYRFQFAL